MQAALRPSLEASLRRLQTAHVDLLLRANRDRVDLLAVREYFRQFDQEPLLDQILADLD